MVLGPEDSLYLRTARLANELGERAAGRTARMACDLNSLLAASAAIHSLRDAGMIIRQLLRSAFEVTPARRGAVVLFDSNGTGESSTFGWERAERLRRRPTIRR